MEFSKAPSAFRFFTRVSLTQATGRKARNLSQLLDHLRQVSDAAIYHHTHRFLSQHQFLSPEPPNDFAYWVASALLDGELAEKLAAVDTISYHTLEDLRAALARVIEERIASGLPGREASPGQEFHFMESLSFVFPTPYEVWTLPEFADALGKVSIHSLYYHIFESRLRLPGKSNDIAEWMEKGLSEPGLARALRSLDPYTQTAEGLRRRILGLVQKRIKEVENARS